MQDLTDRQLLDRELVHFTAQGWQIVSQSESSFQVMYPHAVDGALTALFVFAPLILGILASFVSSTAGASLLSIALVVAALLALGHLCARPKLLYITTDQLRAPATIQHDARGDAVCSVCHSPAWHKDGSCRTCYAQFVKA